ncbi:MAG TPA: hypothetical protein VJ787_14735, partial [Thermoleophilia bacterium]|nr:hypothetical protein [Thermoleophilia bacterium]
RSAAQGVPENAATAREARRRRAGSPETGSRPPDAERLKRGAMTALAAPSAVPATSAGMVRSLPISPL